MKCAPFSSAVSKVSPDVLLFDNTYRGFSFPRHFHESYLIELVEEGTEHFYCKGAYYTNVKKDSIVLINPGEIHTGGDNSHRTEFKCKVFYSDPDAWQNIAGESFSGSKQFASLQFTTPIITDTLVVKTMKQMIAAGTVKGNELLVNELYLQLMMQLMRRHMKETITLDENVQQYARPLKRSLAYIQDNLSQRLLLDDIARSAFISPFHFLRIFKKSMGMTLHQYILALRIDKAKKQLLQKDNSIETILNSVGFIDQSHFTKVFRKMTGLTPGHYKELAD